MPHRTDNNLLETVQVSLIVIAVVNRAITLRQSLPDLTAQYSD